MQIHALILDLHVCTAMTLVSGIVYLMTVHPNTGASLATRVVAISAPAGEAVR